MMRAAIYARRSTEEHQAESLDTQEENARRFIASKGWTLDEAHVFHDTGSRAEWVKRPALHAMASAGKAGGFDVLVIRDDSRLGGDMLRVATLARDLWEAGVKIWSYASGSVLPMDDVTARFLAVARGLASETEREKTASRTRETLERRARDGLVAGGAVYGYRNKPAKDGRGKVRVIDRKQASIVVEIFTRYADGAGLRSIAKALNDRGVPSPRAGKRGAGVWVPSAIHAMLRRPLYIGRMEWGHTHKHYVRGTKARTREHDCSRIVTEDSGLRIISPELWESVRARMPATAPGKKGGAPPRYLLSGILRCGACGGPMTVINGKESHEAVKVYTCARRRDRGGVACDSKLRRALPVVESAVMEWVSANILSETFITATLTELRQRLGARRASQATEGSTLRASERKLAAQLKRLTEMALEAKPAAARAFYEEIEEKRTELERVRTRLQAIETVPAALDLEVRRLEREAKARLADLRGVLKRNPVEARALAQALFPDGLKATGVETAKGRRMRVEGVAAGGKALGLAIGNSASPAGFEPA